MAVPRDNKRKFVSSGNNLEVENGKNDNSNADQNNPEKNAAANKVSQSAFGNENANNLLDEMRTLFARFEQKQIEQAKWWQNRFEVCEKVQKMKMLRTRLDDKTEEKQEIGKARSAGTIHVANGRDEDGNNGIKFSNSIKNGNELSKETQQIIADMEIILRRNLGTTAKQQNINNKNCSKNAKEQPKIGQSLPKIDKIIPTIKKSSKSPPNQQPICKIRAKDENIAEIGHSGLSSDILHAQFDPIDENRKNSNQVYLLHKFDCKTPELLGKNFANKKFPSVSKEKQREQQIRMATSQEEQIHQLKIRIVPINRSVPVEGTRFPIGRGRIVRQLQKFPLKIIPKMNTAWIGIGCLQLNWNFFPSVKPKRNNKRCLVWHPPISFRIFADFAKHDWSMIAKSPINWNRGNGKKLEMRKICHNFMRMFGNGPLRFALPAFATIKMIESSSSLVKENVRAWKRFQRTGECNK